MLNVFGRIGPMAALAGWQSVLLSVIFILIWHQTWRHLRTSSDTVRQIFCIRHVDHFTLRHGQTSPDMVDAHRTGVDTFRQTKDTQDICAVLRVTNYLPKNDPTLSCSSIPVPQPHLERIAWTCVTHPCTRVGYQRSLVAWLKTYAATSWISSSESRPAHAGIAFLPLVTCGEPPSMS